MTRKTRGIKLFSFTPIVVLWDVLERIMFDYLQEKLRDLDERFWTGNLVNYEKYWPSQFVSNWIDSYDHYRGKVGCDQVYAYLANF